MSIRRHTDRAFELSRESWPVPMLPLWRSVEEMLRDSDGRRMVAVEEFTEDGTLVVRAELPGVDPDKDVEITVGDGVLNITAERTEKTEEAGRHFHRREPRYGSFARSISVPEGVDDSKVVATYKDGILEVRVPLPTEAAEETPHRIAVKHG